MVSSPRAVALRTGAGGVVEREHLRLHLRQREPAFGAGLAGRVLGNLAALVIEHPQAVAGQLQGGADRFEQALALFGARPQAVDHDLDGVPRARRQGRDILDVVDLPVHPQADESPAGKIPHQLQVLALAIVDHRRQQDQPALAAGDQGGRDLLGTLPGQRQVVLGAVRLADAGVKQAQVVEDLGDGADRGAGIVRGRLLLDRYGRRQPLDGLDVRLFHQLEKLAGIRRKRFNVAALSLRVDGVERQRRLAGSGQAGKDGHLAARDAHLHRLQIVYAGVLYVYPVHSRFWAQKTILAVGRAFSQCL